LAASHGEGEGRPVTAHVIHARISVDDKPAALLTIENALTGTEERPTYRLALDSYAERRTIVAEIKDYERAGKTRLDLRGWPPSRGLTQVASTP
jgi:hypothetical protein